MNIRMTARYIGLLLLAEAAFMLVPAGVALLYGEGHAVRAMLLGAGATLGAGAALFLPQRRLQTTLYAREGFVVAGVGWLAVSLAGALPFYFSGEMTSFSDAFFESVAGFTTTGTFIHSSMDAWSRGMLFWRNFTQWLGGIGVITFIVAVVRTKGGAGFSLHLFRAESPGPTLGKVMPKVRDSVQNIYIVYLVLSALCLAMLMFGRMPVYDSFCTMFGIAGTGGFGVRADSMASYSPYLQTVCTVFMLLFGVNFTQYILVLRGGPKALFKDEELRWYAIIVVAAIAIITGTLVFNGFGGFGKSLHNAGFMVSSVITSTGLSIGDYSGWPALARAILFVLMVVGATGGSTAGGFKVARVLILFKNLRAGVYRMGHPRSVTAVRMNGKTVEEDTLRKVQLFLFTYCVILLGSFLLISVDDMPLEANLTAVVACLSNIGPGFGLVSNVAHFDEYSTFSQFVLCFDMLLGRLEIFPLVMLMLPSTWRMKS